MNLQYLFYLIIMTPYLIIGFIMGYFIYTLKTLSCIDTTNKCYMVIALLFLGIYFFNSYYKMIDVVGVIK